MKFSNPFRIIWWFIILLTLLCILFQRYKDIINGKTTMVDALIILLFAAVALVPIFSKIKLWGFEVESGEKDQKGERPLTPEVRGDTEKKEAVMLEEENLLPTKEQEEAEPSWIDYLVKDEYQKALDTIDKTINTTTATDELIRLKCWKGFVYREEDFQKGVSYFEGLVAQYPEESRPYNWLANSYLSKNYLKECLTILELGLTKAKEKATLIKTKATYLETIGKSTEAVELLSGYIKDNPSHPDMYLKIYHILKDKDNTTSVNWLLKGLKVSPTDTQLLSVYGNILFDATEYEKALIIFLNLRELEPKSPTHLSMLGNVYLELDLTNMALDAYEKANLMAGEKEEWIISNIGNLYNRVSLYTKANEYLQKGISINSDSQYAHDRLSSNIKKQGEENKKEKELSEKSRKLFYDALSNV